MGIRNEWADEAHTIIQIIYEGRWEWQDLLTSQPETIAMVASVPHRVDFIVDRRFSSWTPAVSGYSATLNALRKDNPDFKGLVVICGNIFAFELLSLYRQKEGKLPFSSSYARDLDEATAQIYAHRAGHLIEVNLPPFPPPPPSMRPDQLLGNN